MYATDWWFLSLVSFCCRQAKAYIYALLHVRTKTSLFQALYQCGHLKKWAGDERGLVEKEGTTGVPVSIVLKTLFRYTSSWYTL